MKLSKEKLLFVVLGVLIILVALTVSVNSLSVDPQTTQIFLPQNSEGLTYLTVYNTTNQTVFTLQPSNTGNVSTSFSNQTVNNDSLITLSIMVGNYSQNTNITTPFVFEASNGGTPVASLVYVYVEANPPQIGNLTINNPFCDGFKTFTIPISGGGLVDPNSIQLNLDGNYYEPVFSNNTINETTTYTPFCTNHTLNLSLNDEASSNVNLVYGNFNSNNESWAFNLTPLIKTNFTVNTYPLITSSSPINLTGWYNNTIPTSFLSVNNLNSTLNNGFWSVLLNLTQGLNTINITSNNNAGNYTQNINITLDQTPPSITTSIPNSSSILDLLNYTYNIIDSQPLASITASVNGQNSFPLYSNSNTLNFNAIPMTTGINTINIQATDDLNLTNNNTIQFTSVPGLTQPTITSLGNGVFNFSFQLKGDDYYFINISGIPATPIITSAYYNGVYNGQKIYAGSLTPSNTINTSFLLSFNFNNTIQSGYYPFNWAVSPA